jgi:hypothetical protein
MHHDLFMDEAGTTGEPHEPINIVVGVVVPKEKQLVVFDLINGVIAEIVPPHFRENFVFHATELMHSEELREGWPLLGAKGRLSLLKSMMYLPCAMQLPVIWTAGKNQAPVDAEVLRSVPQAEFIHIMTFMHCIGTYDQYLGEDGKTGRVIAENVPAAQGRLKYAFEAMRAKPFTNRVYCADTRFGADIDEKSLLDLEFNVSCIQGEPSFVDKRASPFLQIADACAFGIRSYLSGANHSEAYGRLLLGDDAEKILERVKSVSTVIGGSVEWSPRPTGTAAG